MALKPSTLALGALLLLTAGVGAWFALGSIDRNEEPFCFRGGRVGPGDGTGLVVEDVRYDADAHRVSFRLVMIAGEPTQAIEETVSVLQMDPADDSILETEVVAKRVIDDEAGKVAWEIEDQPLAPGLVFFGCRLTGRWVGAESGERPLDGSVGAYGHL